MKKFMLQVHCFTPAGDALEYRVYDCDTVAEMATICEALEASGELARCPSFAKKVKGGWRRLVVPGWND